MASVTQQVGALIAHLEREGWRYLPDGDPAPVRVKLTWRQRRTASSLFRFHIALGARSAQVLVKIPFKRSPFDCMITDTPAARPRPRKALLPPGDSAANLEYAALQIIHEHFSGIGDPTLSAVRALDYLPGSGAIVMEFIEGATLRNLLNGTWRPRSRANKAQLRTAANRGGAWLRYFHDLPPQSYVSTRHERREEFLAHVSDVAEFLAEAVGESRYFARVARTVEHLACAILPDRLPLGRSHGDFAARNLLISRCGRVTVIDTLARFSTSIYEDLGHFLADLKRQPVLALGRLSPLGSDGVRTFEQAFLEGYFGQARVPREIIALYEMQAILDKWASLAQSRREASGPWRRMRHDARMMAGSQLARTLLHERLSTLATERHAWKPLAC